jgi:tetratricopeptide (TPR) repeat protein
LYLNKVVEEKPESAPARLGLAKIAAADGNIDEAVMQYHKAIEGSWPADPGGRSTQDKRIEARIELAGALRQANRQTQTQAELMALAAEIPPRPELQKRLAAMLTDAGLYAKAIEVYRSVLKVNPMDAAALKGLGSAQMAASDFGGAANSFSAALRLEPNDPVTQRQRELCLNVVSLDPSRRGLHAVDRYSRSKQLLSRVTELAQRCTPDKSKLEEAQAAIEAKRKVSSYSDSAEELVNLARELWTEESAACGGAPPDETLEHLMPLLSQAQ